MTSTMIIIFDWYCNPATPPVTGRPTVLLMLLREMVTKLFVLEPVRWNPVSVLCHTNKPSANDSNLHPSILGVSWGYYPVSDFVILFANVTRWKDFMLTRGTAGVYLKLKLLGYKSIVSWSWTCWLHASKSSNICGCHDYVSWMNNPVMDIFISVMLIIPLL